MDQVLQNGMCVLSTQILYRFLVYCEVHLLVTKIHKHKQNLMDNNSMGNNKFPCIIKFNRFFENIFLKNDLSRLP